MKEHIFFTISNGYIFSTIATTIFILFMLNNRFNNKNKFFALIYWFSTFLVFLSCLIVFLTIASIKGIDLGLNILNFSALGIVFSVLLTMSYNLYVKEEENIKKIIHIIDSLIVEGMLIKLSIFEIKNRTNNYRAIKNIHSRIKYIISSQDKKISVLNSVLIGTTIMEIEFVKESYQGLKYYNDLKLDNKDIDNVISERKIELLERLEKLYQVIDKSLEKMMKEHKSIVMDKKNEIEKLKKEFLED